MLSVKLVAQVPFPTNDAVWVNTHYTYTFNPPNPIPIQELTDVDNYCVTGEDTTIQSIACTKVFYCGDNYKGALRDDNGIVYFVPADSSNEYLLYDFTAQLGQTLQNVFIGNHFDNSFMLQDFTVSQIGTETIGGLVRRIVYADSYRWIEGIGCITGLFMEPWPNVSMYEVQLECMSVDGISIYPTEENGACSFTVGLNESSSSIHVFDVYPNPTTGALTLSFGELQSYVKVSIVNTLGQEVQQLSLFNADRAELYLEEASGIYFANIRTQSGNWSSIKIVKH